MSVRLRFSTTKGGTASPSFTSSKYSFFLSAIILSVFVLCCSPSGCYRRFRLIEHRKWWFLLSGTVILLSLAGLIFRHLNLSIDFEGGSQITYPDNAHVTADQVQSVLSSAPFRLNDSEVQLVGGNQISVRTRSLRSVGQSRGVVWE